jgi:predicted ATPase
MAIAAGTRLKQYEIVELIGAGGMGEIYLARDTDLGRRVGLKLLPATFTGDPERMRRFEQEARAASALNHPNIVTIHEIGGASAGRFIVMELVEGRTLRALAREGIGLASVVDLGAQIARALKVAHAAGIVHRDIKPENIMVREDGYVKIVDFGLARLIPSERLESDAATPAATSPGVLLGTYRYMAPEQVRGERAGASSDIFALGIVLYELATGEHPFAADSPIGVLHAILYRSPVAPSSRDRAVPATLDTLILRMLEKDERLRPPAAEMEQALEEMRRRPFDGDAVVPPSGRRTVGRAKERAELRGAFETAARGTGALVCVSGEPGIGKTTVVDEFLNELMGDHCRCTMARGRCSERLAGAEAYLPLLEALEGLLRGPERESAARLLKQVAPSWYVQVSPPETPTLSPGAQPAALGLSQERMKRELAAFLQEMSRLRPLVLFFDDMHWADASTVDLLGYVAGRLDSMPLLVLATYRPSDLLLSKHVFLQLKLDLQGRGICREIPLVFLSREEVADYLRLAFPGHAFPEALSELLHEKTEGSPLFMVDLVRYLRQRGVIDQADDRWVLAQPLPEIARELPESIRSMIERKLDQLGEDDRRLLAAASVQGYEFDSAVIARALDHDAADVEERLAVLDRVHGFVGRVREVEFPDGTVTVRYRFVHVLYQNVLYASIVPARRVSLSGATAHALLEHHGEQKASVASELAFLFEGARDFARAAEYFLLAAQHAARVSANQEAVVLARRGLEVVKKLPDGPARAAHELDLCVALGVPLMATKGWAASEVKETYSRARDLCQSLGETVREFTVLYGLRQFYLIRAEFRTARELGQQLLEIARHEGDPVLLAEASFALGAAMNHMGDFLAAQRQLDEAIAAYDPKQYLSHPSLDVFDPGVGCLCESSWVYWHLGYADEALARVRRAAALARASSYPGSLGFAFAFGAMVHVYRGELDDAREQAEALSAHAERHGLPQFRGWAKSWHGSVIARGGGAAGIGEMREGLTAQRAIGSEIARPHFLSHLAEALLSIGETSDGLKVVGEALEVIEQTEERFCAAELYRIKGELTLAARGAVSEAERCFDRAIAIARDQSARSWELRAVMSRARLWREQGRRHEAGQALSAVYAWFTEGFDTEDLRAARALLDELEASPV